MILAMQGELAKARKGERGIYVFFFCFRVFVFVCVVCFFFFTSSRTNRCGQNLIIATTSFSRIIRKRE